MKKKLVLFSLLLVTVMLLVVGLSLIANQERILKKEFYLKLFHYANDLAKECSDAILVSDDKYLLKNFKTVTEKEDVVYAIVLDREGKVLMHNNKEEIGKIYEDELTLTAIASEKSYTSNVPQKGKYLYETVALIKKGKSHMGAVRMGVSYERLAKDMNKNRFIFFLLLAVFLFISYLGAVSFAESIVKPVKNLLKATKLISEGKLDTRAEVFSKDEIGELAASFNKMTDELEKLQAQLIQQGRLASIGEIASGIAHEIGNPLQTILGNAELLLMDSKSEELQAIKDATLHSKKIIEGLLDFSRQREMNFVSEDINSLLEKTLGLYGKQLELKKIKIVKNYGDVPKITVSLSHIEQVFLNLITNAQKAMPQGGTLTITTNVGQGFSPADNQANLKVCPTDFIEISFKDSGIGIPKENLTRIFEPFFTTKKDGTGLGLSVSYGIVKQHNGEISVFSDGENKGSEFVVKLATGGGG